VDRHRSDGAVESVGTSSSPAVIDEEAAKEASRAMFAAAISHLPPPAPKAGLVGTLESDEGEWADEVGDA
jgi:hypothetical protein